jgi:hypothetical protein
LSPWRRLTTLAQVLAHAFAVRKYLLTAVAATVLGLSLVQMLNADQVLREIAAPSNQRLET